MEESVAGVRDRSRSRRSARPRSRGGSPANLRQVMHAPDETLDLCVLCLFAEGHLIIEDLPGVGKTTLAKALARSVDLSFSRIQFTPDLLPSDVTGVNVFNQGSHEFEFRPGPVFANVLLVDEINRDVAEDPGRAARVRCRSARSRSTASRTRSTCRSSSWRRRTRSSTRAPTRCPRRSSTGSRCGSRSAIRRSPPRRRCSPSRRPRRRSSRSRRSPSASEVLAAIADAQRIYVEESVQRYVVAPARTRRAATAGSSSAPARAPASTCSACAKARALVAQRDYLIPDDVKAVAPAVLSHRLILGPEARTGGLSAEDVVREAVEQLRSRPKDSSC